VGDFFQVTVRNDVDPIQTAYQSNLSLSGTVVAALTDTSAWLISAPLI